MISGKRFFSNSNFLPIHFKGVEVEKFQETTILSRNEANKETMTCICQQDSWYPCHGPAIHIGLHFSVNMLARPFKVGGLGTKTLTWEAGADSGRHAIQQKTHSQQKEAFCKKEADRQSNLSTSVSVSQFLFFQPAFLLATTWQPHEQISFPSYALKKL